MGLGLVLEDGSIGSPLALEDPSTRDDLMLVFRTKPLWLKLLRVFPVLWIILKENIKYEQYYKLHFN